MLLDDVEHIVMQHGFNVGPSDDMFLFTDGSTLIIGQEFSSKAAVQKELSKSALNSSFECNIVKSSPSIYVVRCINKGCTWRIWTSKVRDSTLFSIRTYCNTYM
ncbi:hypothetical protein F511_17763 [Dorcoceras hygrometricum]|uniref:Transposase MuDR plant domain-containing protein n=1 Tax=Dorcoceras hygrometricum TaxID=472368 RepID=A0A2Z7BHD8_9LAMI|nr:hypothetical protein F511_17763 [Dorcoceras hygrometricum]